MRQQAWIKVDQEFFCVNCESFSLVAVQIWCEGRIFSMERIFDRELIEFVISL